MVVSNNRGLSVSGKVPLVLDKSSWAPPSTSVGKSNEEIGDQCGSWLETEEETLLKNHMRWARIKVKGPLEQIPRFVEIANGDIVFSLLIWVEAPARYRMVNKCRRDHQDESDKSRNKVDNLFTSLKEKETEHERG